MRPTSSNPADPAVVAVAAVAVVAVAAVAAVAGKVSLFPVVDADRPSHEGRSAFRTGATYPKAIATANCNEN